MDRQFQAKVLEKLPIDAGFFGSFLYLKPVEHILSGFCAEEVRNGVYISKYCYLLCDRSDDLNLNFSERLPYPECFIDFDVIDKADRANEFVNRILPFMENAKQNLDVLALYKFIQNNEKILRNEWVMKTYILLQVLMGKYADALVNLEKILANQYSGAREQIAKECGEIKLLLEEDPSSAKNRLVEWEGQMKSRVLLL